MPLAEKGVRGKGRQPLSPPQLTEAPERDERSGRISDYQLPRRGPLKVLI
jgi:hypothetical protein